MATGGRRRRGPVTLVVLGVLLMLAATVAVVVALAVYGSRAADSVVEAADRRDDLLAQVPVPGTEEVELEAGADYQVLAFGSRLVAARGGFGEGDELDPLPFAEPQVAVTAPDGSPVPLSEPFLDLSSTTGDVDSVSIGDLEVTESGTYTIAADGNGRRVRSIGVTPGLDLGDTAGALASGGLVALGAIVVGGTGFLLLLVGVVWWAAGNATRTVPTAPPPPPAGY